MQMNGGPRRRGQTIDFKTSNFSETKGVVSNGKIKG